MNRDHDTALLDHAWRHFEFHANQRLSLFNFCIIWAGLIIAAWSQTMTGDNSLPIAGVVLGGLLTISPIVFWRMDQRNSHLTKLSESVLNDAENLSFDGRSILFNSDRADAYIRKGLLKFAFADQWSHGQSLKVLFGLIGAIGAMGLGFSIWTLCRS